MGEVPLSLHVNAEIGRRLDEEANRQRVSAESIAAKAIERYLEAEELERQIMRQRVAEADNGIFISAEAMKRWMKELDDDIDAPAPAPDVFVHR